MKSIRSFLLLTVTALGLVVVGAPAQASAYTYYFVCAREPGRAEEKCYYVPKVVFKTVVRNHAFSTPVPAPPMTGAPISFPDVE